MQRIGDAIANSTNLLSLGIQEFGDDEMVVADQWLFDVFCGLARNRSIEHLEINGIHYTTWNPFEAILPFFEHNRNLRSIQLHCFDLTQDNFESFLFALSLCDSNQLERILLIDNNRGAIEVTRFINSLGDHHNLLELEIRDNIISRNGFLALSKLLQCPMSKINCLKVGASFDDECIAIFTGDLVVNKTIKILEVNGRNVTANGLGILSCVLRSPICLLKRLSLHRATLDDESITDIGDSLVKNKVLNYLDLSGNHQITPAGWHGLSICLRSPTLHCRTFMSTTVRK